MSAPTLTKTWTFLVNQRITPFVSLNATMGAILYGIKNFLVGTMAYTLKYSCNGTTGPSSSSDHTDRWTGPADCITRGANAASAQSFVVLTDGNGADILISYQGATDDIAYISMSIGSIFLPAGTATNQPTATDECVGCSATTWINATASQDRVWHIQASTDKKLFRFWIYRQSALARQIIVEQCTATTGAITWTVPVIIGNSLAVGPTNLTAQGGCMGTGGAIGATNAVSARIPSTNLVLIGGGEMFSGVTNPWTVTAPELHAAAPIVPLSVASTTTNFQGKLGNRFDCWAIYCSTFAQGDVVGTNQFAILGTTLWPWDGINAPQIT